MNFNNDNKTFKLGYSISISAHLIALIALFIIQTYKFNKAIPISESSFPSSIKVDVVGLPNILKKDVEQIVNEQQVEPDSKDTMSLDENKKIITSKLKILDKLKNLKQKEEYLKKIKQIKGLKTEGVFSESAINVATTSGVGSGTNTVPSNYDEYLLAVKTLIRRNWKVPRWMEKSEYQAVISLVIKTDGSIDNLSVNESSGNSLFDNLAISAIENSTPFPAPPITVQETLQNDGITLSFP